MIFWAVTGPMPSIPSSCSAVALPRLIGPLWRARRRARRDGTGAGDHHLLPVAEPRRQVDRILVGAAGEPAGSPDGVGHPRPGRQPIDAGAPDVTRDVDDDVARAPRLV